MSFVDSDSGKFTLLVYGSKQLSKIVQLAVFWRNVQQSSLGVSTFEVIQDPLLHGLKCLTINGSDLNSSGSQSSDLIVH